MALPPLAADSASVVIRGRFDPKSISPSWLHFEGLIGQKEFEDAKFELLVPDVAIFEAGWLRCQVESGGFQVSTQQEAEFERLRDIAMGVLDKHSETPIGVMGLNRQVHFGVPSLAQWHAVGDTLTPKEIWGGALETPGMRSVTLWGARPDLYTGYIQVQIEPSQLYPLSVYISHNDHFALGTVESPIRSRPNTLETPKLDSEAASSEKVPIALRILAEEWGSFMQRSEQVVQRVARLAGQQR